MKSLKNFLQDETGLELSEYAVAAAIVVAGLVAAFSGLGDAIKTKIEALKTAVS
jgi:pilus assembly protein Flp/PilA